MRIVFVHHIPKSVLGLLGTGVCLFALLGASQMRVYLPEDYSKKDLLEIRTKKEIRELGLDKLISRAALLNVLHYQRKTGKTLVQILQEPEWARRLHLQPEKYKATWYMANPFDVLPPHLQEAIKKKEIPFKSRTHVWEWCREHKVPKRWRKALYAALIETTPHNLWRASRGMRPYTTNGDFLEPIVVDKGNGNIELRNGHIAIDPRVVPMNTELFLIVKIKGEERLVKVKAADTGGAIKGWHVDLPIHVGPEAKSLPYTLLPAAYIRNPTVKLLIPFSTWNRAQRTRQKSNLNQTA